MARVRVRIGGERTVNLGFGDFVTRKQAHAHLFKHVVRLSEQREDELESTVDPEQWSAEIPDPPLYPRLSARREEALAALRVVDGCRLGREGATTGKPCAHCGDEKARKRVDDAFADLLGAYQDAAHRTLLWSFENPARTRPRLLSFVDPNRDAVRVKAVDARGNCAIGSIGREKQDVELVSCYRLPERRPYRAVWQDLCREQAGYRREGTAVNIELLPREGAS